MERGSSLSDRQQKFLGKTLGYVAESGRIDGALTIENERFQVLTWVQARGPALRFPRPFVDSVQCYAVVLAGGDPSSWACGQELDPGAMGCIAGMSVDARVTKPLGSSVVVHHCPDAIATVFDTASGQQVVVRPAGEFTLVELDDLKVTRVTVHWPDGRTASEPILD